MQKYSQFWRIFILVFSTHNYFNSSGCHNLINWRAQGALMYTLQWYSICNKNAARSNLPHCCLQNCLAFDIRTDIIYLVIMAGPAIIPIQGLSEHNDQEINYDLSRSTSGLKKAVPGWNNFLNSTAPGFPLRDPEIRNAFHRQRVFPYWLFSLKLPV